MIGALQQVAGDFGEEPLDLVDPGRVRGRERLEYGAEKVLGSTDLLEDPGALYFYAPDATHRELLAAFFTKLLFELVDGVKIAGERTAVSVALHDLNDAVRLASAEHVAKNKKIPRTNAGDLSMTDPKTPYCPLGLKEATLVARAGLETATPRVVQPVARINGTGLKPRVIST